MILLLKNTHKEIIAGAVLGSAAILAGFFVLGKKGKLGSKIQNFINNLFHKSNSNSNTGTKLFHIKDGNKVELNSKNKMFFDADNKKVSSLNLQDGVFLTQNNDKFNGIMQTTNKDDKLVETIFKDGRVSEVKIDGAKFKTINYKDNNRTDITQFNKNSEAIHHLIAKNSCDGYLRDNADKIITQDFPNKNKTIYTIIDKKNHLMEINTTTNNDSFIRNHKLFDTKNKKIIQSGNYVENTRYIKGVGGLVIDNGDIKYIFKPEFYSTRYIGNLNGENWDKYPPAIEQTLPNGVVKFFNRYKEETGYILPNGDEIRFSGCTGSIDYTTKKIDNALGIEGPFNKLCCGELLQLGDKTDPPLSEDKISSFSKLIDKFAPDDKIKKFLKPVESQDFTQLELDIHRLGFNPGLHFFDKNSYEHALRDPDARIRTSSVLFEPIIKLLEQYGI